MKDWGLEEWWHAFLLVFGIVFTTWLFWFTIKHGNEDLDPQCLAENRRIGRKYNGGTSPLDRAPLKNCLKSEFNKQKEKEE